MSKLPDVNLLVAISKADHPHQERALPDGTGLAGQGVHLPAHGDALDLGGEGAAPAGGPVEQVVALLQEGAGGGDLVVGE